MSSLLTITQAAHLLKVRPAYIHQLVAKGRLQFVQGEQLEKAAVTRLAQLMDRLRHEGLAVMVQMQEERRE